MNNIITLLILMLFINGCSVINTGNCNKNTLKQAYKDGLIQNSLYHAIIDVNNEIENKKGVVDTNLLFVSFEKAEGECCVLIGKSNMYNDYMKGYLMIKNKMISFVIIDSICYSSNFVEIDKLPKKVPNDFKKFKFKDGDYYSDPSGRKYKIYNKDSLDFIGQF